MFNSRPTALIFLFYTCTIVVSYRGDICQNEEVDHYRQFSQTINQNELVKVRGESKEITEVRDMAKIVLDERTFEKFPVQEDGYIGWINIAKSISYNHSRKFGVLLLGLERTLEVNEIVKENSDLACEVILLKWLKMEGTKNEPITFRTLVNVFYELSEYYGNNYGELAYKIAYTAEAHGTMDTDYIPALARKYSLELLEKYQREYVINSSQWIPKMLDRNITFVDLEMKEDNNDNITLDNLFHDVQDGMRILFTGRPGVGKSTITRHLSKYIHLEHFFLIIKLHLGELDYLINNLDALLKINGKSFYSNDIVFISNFIQRTSGRGVCFLLDGYDEYIPSKHGNYINGLVTGNELTKSVVIVTSRPSAVKDMKFLFQRKIEIIGFGERGIDTYLKQLHLSDEQNTMIYQYLYNHPNIRQMCYLPLHLSMLVYVSIVTTDSSTLTLLDTETQLYSNFLALSIKQYEKVRHERAVESLKECLIDPDTQSDLCNILRSISKIAFDGLNNRTQIFTSLSLTGLSNASGEIEALSLFKVEMSYDRDGIKFLKYSYSHPTFQEFLAGFYLTTLSKETQLNYINYWWMHEVYKYFFGLIRRMSKYEDEMILNMFVSFAKEDLATYQNQELYIMKCAHEAARDSQYIPYLQAAGVISQNKSISAEADYSYNCWYLGYILAQIALHELTVSEFSDVALCISFINKYLKNDARTAGTANVTKLALGRYSFGHWAWFTNEEDSMDIVQITEFLSVFKSSLTHLELRYVKLEQTDSILQLWEVLKSFRKLQSIALSVNISIIKEGYLVKGLQGLTELKHLELSVIDKHDDDTIIPDGLLEFRNLNQLQSLTLYISWNKNLVDVNITALLGGLKHLMSLETLSVHCLLYTGFRNDGANELLLGIQEVGSIKNLTLYLDLCWDEGLGNVSVKELSETLNGLRKLLIKLSLCIDFDFTGIKGHIGVIELADGLRNLTELEDLRLELRWEMVANDTVDEAAIVLADRLKHLSKLHTLELNLKHNGSCNRIVALFPSLSNLRNLNLKWTRPGGLIGQTDVKRLLNELKYVKQLQKLDLSWNTIVDDDMGPLTEALKEMKNLDTLDLSRNEIGDEGIKLLAELFDSPQQYLCNLQALILSFNKFSKIGAKVLAGKLKNQSHNLHILEFDLKLGAYSAEVLSLQQQQKVINKTVTTILPEKSLFSTISEHLYYYYYYNIMFSALLGIGMVGAFLYFKSKASRKIVFSSEISIALSCSSFSVSTAWELKRLDNVKLNGSETVIVILDTTIDSSFPSFMNKEIVGIKIGKSFPTFTGREIFVIDCLPHNIPVTSNIHGTICSAVAVGSSPDMTTAGVIHRGVAPDARLIVYRIAEGECCYSEAILNALQDIQSKVENDILQVDVVSISYDCDESCEQQIYDRIKILTEMGITFVAAAGNRGHYQPRASIPARFDSVLSVGALDRNGKMSPFTSKGKVDVYAPGEDIEFPSTEGKFWGTSFATPAVGGLVLLLKQWANIIGPPAVENIHRVEILRKIFSKDMVVKSDGGDVDIFDPVGFFMNVRNNPTILNDIVQKYLYEECMDCN